MPPGWVMRAFPINFMRPTWFVFQQINVQIHNHVAVPFNVTLQLFEFL